jgi:GTP-binding protein HflX
LIACFKATLEEAIHANLLLHVVDASNPQAARQMDVVKNVLAELKCSEKNIITVFNKIDCLAEPQSVLKVLKQIDPIGIPVSAVKREGLELLLERSRWFFHRPAIHLTLDIDCRAGKLLSFLKKHASIHETQYIDETARIELSISSNWLGPMRQFSQDYKILQCSDPQAQIELTH